SARTGGLLVQRVSSSNFSLADFYASTDGGMTWRRRPAPAAGSIAVEASGRTGLAGGGGGTALYRSGDQGGHLAARALPTTGTRTAVGLPTGQVLPMATLRDNRSELDFTTGSRRTGSVPLAMPLGEGVLPATAQAGTGLLIADPAGGHLYRT